MDSFMLFALLGFIGFTLFGILYTLNQKKD
jgi:hypothetical protein